MRTFFSIIIPVYNVAPYLRECLDSVLAQTFLGWECLCVNDGSTDESGAILDEYAQKDSRFRVFHKPNGGVGSARNCGITHAHGDYILFLDGDDAIVPGSIKLLMNALEKHSVDILRFAHAYVKQHGEIAEIKEEDNRACQVYDMTKPSDAVRVFNDYAMGGLLAWGACYRKALISAISFKKMPNGEDVLFGTEAICAAQMVGVVDAICYSYLDRDASAVKKKNLRHLKSVVETAHSLAAVVKQWRYYPLVKVRVFRKMRTFLIGIGWTVMKCLPTTDKREGWRILHNGMRKVFCEEKIAQGYSYFIYKVVLLLPIKPLAWCLLRLPWCCRAWLMKNNLVRMLWNKIR